MRKAHSAYVTELEVHQRDASAANRALELLGREVILFTEKREVGKPGDFDHMADEELTAFIEAQAKSCASLSASCCLRQPRSSARPNNRKNAGGHWSLIIVGAGDAPPPRTLLASAFYYSTRIPFH